MQVIPKYKTVYLADFSAPIDWDFEQIVWVKDKFTREYLQIFQPIEMAVNSFNPYITKNRAFAIYPTKILVSHYPDNRCPRRLLIKYIPLVYYKILDKNGIEMPDHHSGRPRTYLEAKRMVDLLNSPNNKGEYYPYKMEEI